MMKSVNIINTEVFIFQGIPVTNFYYLLILPVSLLIFNFL